MVNFFVFNDLSEIKNISKQILKISKYKNIVFYGEMGVGKTTLINSLCLLLYTIDKVTSPTFSIVNEYLCEEGGKVFHFDFYRINDRNQAFDIGFEEYLESDNFCLIEWPEIILDFLPKNYVEVKMSIENGNRKITIKNIE
jgi:tRNA threonylcarbamoyladenosine biosynthesis protein TsaE|tara:strand:- start:254 stop:676 length:423 start_codon:yes stop_codon:yes gene_type:complete